MKNIMPPKIFASAIFVMVIVHFVDPIQLITSTWWRLSGTILVASGLVLNVIAAAQFKRFQTTIKPFQISSSLVSTGVFRYSRNPMYLGMALALAGVATILGSLWSWSVIVPFIATIELRFIRKEEQILAKTFGAEFQNYKNQVRRWF